MIGIKADRLQKCIFILLCVMAASSWGTDYVKKSATDYGMMCGCKNIFYVKHFEAPEPVSEDFTTNAIRVATPTYGATAGSDKILTTVAGDYSVLSIPDDIVECFMKGKLNRLTGYFSTNRGEYFELSGEYTVSGAVKKIPSFYPVGIPGWKQFDFYFDFTGINVTITNVQFKVKSPDATIPVYIDEIRICTFCDGTIKPEGPKLSALTITPGTWSAPFKRDDYSYIITVPQNADQVIITPSVTGNPAPIIKIRGGAPWTSGAPFTFTLGDAESVPIDINVKKTVCEQTTYLLTIVKQITADATLIDLKVSQGTLCPEFYRFTTDYTDLNSGPVNSLTITPTLYDPASTITVNGQGVSNQTESGDIDVSVNKTVTIVVTARDGVTQKTYTVTVVDNVPVITFTAASGSGLESVANPVINVWISPPPPAGRVIGVHYEATGGTALNGGIDYSLPSGILNFTSANTVMQVPIAIVDDGTPKANRTIDITLSASTCGAVLGGITQYEYTIIDKEAKIIYVKTPANGGDDGNDGFSWTKAKATVNAALTAAVGLSPSNANAVQIWVAAGTYYPPSIPFGVYHPLEMVPYVDMLGGFPALGGNSSERNWRTNQTILSGDLLGNDGTDWPKDPTDTRLSDNVGPIIIGADISTLDGFILENGFDCGGPGNKGGGAMRNSASPTVLNCVFRRNLEAMMVNGGAVQNKDASPKFYNCIFENNVSSFSGGALADLGGGVTIYNCLFNGNIAMDKGGAIYAPTGSFTEDIHNCTFVNNFAASDGGGIYAPDRLLNIVGCIFANNSGTIGQEDISLPSSNPSCWQYVQYSRTKNIWTGVGSNNTIADPLLTYDYHLSSVLSPCWSGGSPFDNYIYYPIRDGYGNALDLDGNRRLRGAGIPVDMGCYELQTSVEEVVSFIYPSGSDFESVTNPEILVSITPAPQSNITVNYSATGGTATKGVDYILPDGFLTFTPSSTTQSIPLTIVNDNIPEADETVIISLTGSSGSAAWGANPTYTCTIRNDDYTLTTTAINGSVTMNPAGGTYNDGTVVTLTAAPNANYHFVNWSGDVSGTTNSVTVTMDANKSVTANFEPNYSISFAAASGSGAESVTSPTITVLVTPAPISSVTVNYSVTGGTATGGGVDYALANGTLTFAPGQTSKTIPLTVVIDNLPESDETVIIGLSSPSPGASLGTNSTYTYTIVNDDYTLTTTATNGTVALNPAGGTYNSGTVVTISATANSGYHFVNWTGDASGTTPTTTVTMNSNKAVTANFEPNYTIAFTAVSGSGVESVTSPTITVSVSPPPISNVTVNYAATGGTATGGGSDYTLPSGTLTFASGQTSTTIPLTVVHDVVVEANETVIIGLSGPSSGSSLGSNSTYTYTILNDDYTLTIIANNGTVSLNPAGGTYNAGTVVTLTETPNANYYFTGWSGDASGTANSTTVTMTGNKTVTANFTILNTIAFTAVSGSGAESVTSPTITVTVSPTPTANVMVNYAVTGGTATGGGADYTLASGTLTFTSGQTSKTLPLTVVNDNVPEADETVIIGLSSPSAGSVLGTNSTYIYTILNNDYMLTTTATNGTVVLNPAGGTYNSGTVVTITATANTGYHFVSWSGDASGTSNPVTVTLNANKAVTANFEPNYIIAFMATTGSGAESVTSPTITVSVSPQPISSVTVNYSVTGGTATGGGNDYTLANGTLTFASGQTSKTIPLTVVNDAVVEPNETVIIGLSGPSAGSAIGTNSTFTYTILNDDYTLTTVATNGTVALSPAGGTYNSGTVVTLTAAANANYHFVSWSGSITSTTNPVTVTMDANKSVTANFEPNYTIAFTAASGSGAESVTSPTITVSVSPAPISNVTVNYAVVGGTATGGGVDYTLADGTLTFASGQTSKTIPLTVVNDNVPEPDETVTIGLSNPSGGSSIGTNSTYTYTILNNDYTLTIIANNGTVALNPAGGTYNANTVVTLTATANPNYHFVSWSGDASGSTNPVTVTMNANKTVTANFEPNYTIAFSVGSGSGAESVTSPTITVSVSPAPISNVTVNYSVTGGTATGGGNDYTLANGTLTFTSGQTSKTIPLTVVNDNVPEPDETVTIGLSNPSAGSAIGANFTYTYTILNNDYTLTTSATNGSVALSPAGGTYNANTVVTLTATANGGYHFVSWSGDASGTTNPVTVTMNSNKSVTANFEPNYTIAFSVGSGSGAESVTNPIITVSVSPTPISSVTVNYAVTGGTATGGGNDYTLVNGTLTFASGQTSKTIPLTIVNDVVPEPNETVIIGLSSPSVGSAIGTNSTFTYTILNDDYTLTIVATNGSVGLNPAGGTYNAGTVVTLTPNPNANYVFSSWSGDLTGNANPGSITMNSNKTVTANFVISLDVIKVIGNYYESFFIKNNNTLWACGDNSHYQLGNGTNNLVGLPIQVNTNIKNAAAGYQYCIFLKMDGTVWACGENSYGQFGNGTTNSYTIPTQIMSGIMDIAATYKTCYYLKSDGTLWTCGANYWGQCGDGTIVDRSTPVQILSNVKNIVPGFAIKTDNTLWAWGANLYGQLGDGSTSQKLSPIQVMTNVQRVATGTMHTLILKTDGTLLGCGRNDYGQIGIGSTTTPPNPVQILNNVQNIAAGAFHSLILKTDGTLWSCGDNSSAELGIGSSIALSTIPQLVMNNVQYIDVGSYHSVILKIDKTVWTFGMNDAGQLGDGTNNRYQYYPEKISF